MPEHVAGTCQTSRNMSKFEFLFTYFSTTKIWIFHSFIRCIPCADGVVLVEIIEIRRFGLFYGTDHYVLYTVMYFFTSAPASVYVLSLQGICTWKKRRLQKSSKFPHFSFSPRNVRTGKMYSIRSLSHTYVHRSDTQTKNRCIFRCKRPYAKPLQVP